MLEKRLGPKIEIAAQSTTNFVRPQAVLFEMDGGYVWYEGVGLGGGVVWGLCGRPACISVGKERGKGAWG